MTQMEYLKQQLLAVLAIDSPTGHTAAAAQYVLGQYRALGFSPVLTNKGGVLVCVNEGCPGGEGGLLLEAHLDTLGAMVAEIKPNGRLRLTPLGGLNANNTEAENVRLATRSGKVFSGTFQLKNASVPCEWRIFERKTHVRFHGTCAGRRRGLQRRCAGAGHPHGRHCLF